MSEEVELKLKRRIQVIVIAAMSLFFVLVTVVVFQFGIRIHQEAQARSLTKHNETLQQQIDEAKENKEYFGSDEFKYDFALRYLNRGRPGDIVIF